MFPRVAFHDIKASKLNSHEAKTKLAERETLLHSSVIAEIKPYNITYNMTFTSFCSASGGRLQLFDPGLGPTVRRERFRNKSSDPVICCWCRRGHSCGVFAMATA